MCAHALGDHRTQHSTIDQRFVAHRTRSNVPQPPLRGVAHRRRLGAQSQRPGKIQGPVAITVAAGKPDKRKRDLDNIASKAFLDLMVAHQVITDDSMVVSLASRWADDVAPGRVAVTVAAAN